MPKKIKEKKIAKRSGSHSGKSKCQDYPFGVRRKSSDGSDLAPKSFRIKGKKLLSECTEEELKKVEVR